MSTLKVNNLLETDGSVLPRIIQVVVTSSTTQESVTANTELTTYRRTITPTNAGNKMLLIANMAVGADAAYDGGISFMFEGSDIAASEGSGGTECSFATGMSVNNANCDQFTGFHIHHPNTTSQVTYSLKGKPNGSRSMFINRRGLDTTYGFRSRFIVIEIGGI
tara:strand:+ start:196 stop:687 length:492 start_codon:yes stop_codon:yes gene_type:complete